MNLTQHEPDSPAGEPSWFEQPHNIKRLIVALVADCGLLLLVDLFYKDPRPHFGVETSFGFQAWLGFAAFVGIVFLGRLLRMIVRRPEDYYDR